MRLYDAAYDLPEEHWFRSMLFRMRFFGKSKSGFPNPKTDFAFFVANPKTDHESIKSTFRVDSSDQIQIQIFEIHNLSVFLGKDLKKVFLTIKVVFRKTKIIRNRCRTCMTF